MMNKHTKETIKEYAFPIITGIAAGLYLSKVSIIIGIVALLVAVTLNLKVHSIFKKWENPDTFFENAAQGWVMFAGAAIMMELTPSFPSGSLTQVLIVICIMGFFFSLRMGIATSRFKETQKE